jgi:hypothetical protein
MLARACSENKMKALAREVFGHKPTKVGLFECCELDELEAFATQHIDNELD